ncbi:MAG: WecB/TagA/CpsF family glycosyltransferase [Chloroflexi bacterium]|nr:WecB/TagA/CpsF family glycosyltransferase [Chloroflexota bacterium]
MPDAPRILVVQIADIGDLILSTPALSALRERHPDAHITLLTTPHSAPILAGLDLVDAILTFERGALTRPRHLPRDLRRAVALARRLRRGRFDVTIFLHHFSTRAGSLKFAGIAAAAGSPQRVGLDNGQAGFLTQRLPDHGFGARHQAQYWLDLVALLGADSTPRPAQIARDDQAADRLLPGSDAADRLRVAIHTGSGGYSRARRWSPESFAAVAAARIGHDGAQIILVGGPGDDSAAVTAAMRSADLDHLVDLTGQTSLAALAGVLARCDLCIGADSGVLHAAAAVGLPVVAIFGPSNHAAWHPWTPTSAHRVVRSAPECSPCSYVGHGVGARDGCPARTCMRLVTAQHVIAAARSLLHAADPAPEVPTAPQHAVVEQLLILGLPVSVITFARWLALIGAWIDADRAAGVQRPRHICTINPEFMMIAQHDPIFRGILRRAALTVPDGVGVLWAARRLGHLLPERVTGSDGVPLIAAAAADRGWRLFLLGAGPGVAARAGDVLRARHPALQIAGVYAGSPSPEAEDEIVARVNDSHADILFVAYGAPEQDKWIARNLPRLHVTMAMGVGGSLDFIAGVIPRAPLWLRNLGLEWLYRLYLQPWRFRRMLRLPRFVIAVLRDQRRQQRHDQHRQM